MAECLYLHIGTPKSATTYLQSLVDVSARALAAAQVHLPAENRYSILRDFLGRRRSPTDAGAWQRFIGGLSDHRGDALYSNEMLVSLSPVQIETFVHAMPCAKVHVVVTARDLTRVVPSQWQTMIKNGSTLSWADFTDAVCTQPPVVGRDAWPPASGVPEDEVSRRFWIKHDLPAIVTRWRSPSAHPQVTLVTVPPKGGDPSELARRFSAVIGVDLAPRAPMVADANTSLGAVSAELMRRLNTQLEGASRTARRTAFRDILGKDVLSQAAAGEPRIGLRESQLTALEDVAATMVAELTSSGVVVKGALAELLPSSGSAVEAGVDPGRVSEIELLDAAFTGLAGVIRAYGTLADKHPEDLSTTPGS